MEEVIDYFSDDSENLDEAECGDRFVCRNFNELKSIHLLQESAG